MRQQADKVIFVACGEQPKETPWEEWLKKQLSQRELGDVEIIDYRDGEFIIFQHHNSKHLDFPVFPNPNPNKVMVILISSKVELPPDAMIQENIKYSLIRFRELEDPWALNELEWTIRKLNGEKVYLHGPKSHTDENRPLTLEELHHAYPDRWLLLKVVEYDPKTLKVKTAYKVSESMESGDLFAQVSNTPGIHFAIESTATHPYIGLRFA